MCFFGFLYLFIELSSSQIHLKCKFSHFIPNPAPTQLPILDHFATMSPLPLPSPSTTSSSPFDNKTPSASPSLSRRTIVVIASVLSAAVIFVLAVATVHCIRSRRRSETHSKQQADIAQSLRRAQPPVLTLDINVPRLCDMQRDASRSQTSRRAMGRDVVLGPLPYLHASQTTPVHTTDHTSAAPPLPTRSPVRSASKQPGVCSRLPTMGSSQPPGVNGRSPEHSRSSPGGYVGKFGDDIGGEAARPEMPEMPKRVWDPRERKTIILS